MTRDEKLTLQSNYRDHICYLVGYSEKVNKIHSLYLYTHSILRQWKAFWDIDELRQDENISHGMHFLTWGQGILLISAHKQGASEATTAENTIYNCKTPQLPKRQNASVAPGFGSELPLLAARAGNQWAVNRVAGWLLEAARCELWAACHKNVPQHVAVAGRVYYLIHSLEPPVCDWKSLNTCW